jgi:hypothetical protein
MPPYCDLHHRYFERNSREDGPRYVCFDCQREAEARRDTALYDASVARGLRERIRWLEVCLNVAVRQAGGVVRVSAVALAMKEPLAVMALSDPPTADLMLVVEPPRCSDAVDPHAPRTSEGPTRERKSS